MALSQEVEAYCTVVETDTYFNGRLASDAWTSASTTLKEQALTTAVNMLDDMSWDGVVDSDTQSHAFPRTIAYFEPRVGKTLYYSLEVPPRITKAVQELALFLLANPPEPASAGTVENLQVGPITLTNIRSTSLPSTVLTQVRPLLLNGGSRLVWRAN